jgi:hypothetical protein
MHFLIIGSWVIHERKYMTVMLMFLVVNVSLHRIMGKLKKPHAYTEVDLLSKYPLELSVHCLFYCKRLD